MSEKETKHLETIGHACATLQASYGAVRRALAEVGAEPVLILNGLPHYAETDVERAAEQLQQRRQCDMQGAATGPSENDERADSCREASRR
jgi:hypothetical protein